MFRNRNKIISLVFYKFLKFITISISIFIIWLLINDYYFDTIKEQFISKARKAARRARDAARRAAERAAKKAKEEAERAAKKAKEEAEKAAKKAKEEAERAAKAALEKAKMLAQLKQLFVEIGKLGGSIKTIVNVF